MRILKYKLFKESALLKLSNNTDMELISKIESLISPPSKILEISCGNCADSIRLKNLGYRVKCTDNNQEYVNNAIRNNIDCINHETSMLFPFNDKTFNLIYSRLGLHYFSNDKLVEIFKEISRIGDYLVFTVKLVNDIQTGKVILTKEKWLELVSIDFNIISNEEKTGILYDNQSNWLEIVAKSKDDKK